MMKNKYAVAKTSPQDVNLSTQRPDRDFNTPATDPNPDAPIYPYGGGSYPDYNNGTAQDVNYDIYGGSYAQSGTLLDLLSASEAQAAAPGRRSAMAYSRTDIINAEDPPAQTGTQTSGDMTMPSLDSIWESYGTAITASIGIVIGILIGKRL